MPYLFIDNYEDSDTTFATRTDPSDDNIPSTYVDIVGSKGDRLILKELDSNIRYQIKRKNFFALMDFGLVLRVGSDLVVIEDTEVAVPAGPTRGSRRGRIGGG